MTPQLTKIAECLSESHAREIKLARCLAESLKRIQTLESSAKTKDTKVKATELRFNAAVRDLAEQLAKQTAENEELIRKMEEAIKVEFPAQLAALKAEFATPAAQAAAPQSFNPRGDYEAGEKYKPFDYVSSNGSSYIALVENPTQPPSKKSKQWMLVAARGAGGGGVTVFGTAAYRDVGQEPGNVLELTGNGEISLGHNNGADGVLRIYDNFLEDYCAVRSVNGSLTINANPIALLSQVGDRYLTSSTTSNTVSNGAKTFTVGTGLAYSPTQDITIVFNASNHMHGSVTSYNSGTGALVVDVNHHTGSGTYAVWTVNVGGIGAGAIPSGGTTGQVLAKVSSANYDDAWVTPTVAVGGVTGLGTGVATALAVNAGSAGAFIRTTDTATTTTAGIVPGIGGTVLTNAANLAFVASSAVMIWPTGSNIFAAATTGSGSTTRNELSASATTGSTASSTSLVRSQGPSNFPFSAGTTYNASNNAVDYDRPLIWSFNLGGMGTEVSTGTVRISFGKSGADGVGQLTRKGWQIRIEGSSSRTVFIAAHNGTTLGTEVAVTGSAINNGGFDIKPVVVVCSGGTMSLYAGDAALNLGTPTATCTGGPTGASALTPYLQVEVLNGATASAHRCDISNIRTVILK